MEGGPFHSFHNPGECPPRRPTWHETNIGPDMTLVGMPNTESLSRLSDRRSTRSRGTVRELGVGGRWRVRVSLGRDASGKRLYATRTVRGSASDAKRVLTEMLRTRDRGVSPALARETLDEWIRIWLRDHCTDISERTRVGYEDLFRRYLTPELRGRKVAQLTVAEVQKWVSALAASELSPTTVRSAHAALRACLSDAARLEMVMRNVAKGVVLPKKEHREMRALSPQEAQKFLHGLAASPYRTLFLVWLHTGLRNAELAALRWDDFDGTTLHVRRALVFAGRRKPQAVGPTKTGKPRSIPLSSDVVAALKRHRKEQVEHMMNYRGVYVDAGLLFANMRGGTIDFHNIQRRFFKPLLRRLELPDIRMYDLRHTCATLLFAAGENVKVVQERLGHSTPVLTLTTYTHVLPGQQAQASERLQRVLRLG